MMNFENWTKIMQAYGFASGRNVCEELIAAHQSKGRHYHTDEHISACLRHLEKVRHDVTDWKSLALAFWFHDAVYKPFSSTNERDSADWAIRFLKANQASADQITRIDELIMATCHNGEASDHDMQILIDIDLSILGARPEVYNVYEVNIRKEYKRVPGFIFKSNRKKILHSFLAKPRIYGTDYFFEKLETTARENLRRAAANL